MHFKRFIPIGVFCLILTACRTHSPASTRTPPAQAGIPTATEVDRARLALSEFFDALSRHEYQTAATYYGGSYHELQRFYKDVDPQDRAALFKSACERPATSPCRFYCWKIKDIVGQGQTAAGDYYFTVRFEDKDGNLLTGGDNLTPAPCGPPEECPRSKYTYTMAKVADRYLVRTLPVSTGCFP